MTAASLMQNIIKLSVEVKEHERYIEMLEAKLDCFFTGNIPENANLDMVVLATAGRKRLEEMRKKPKLLAS